MDVNWICPSRENNVRSVRTEHSRKKSITARAQTCGRLLGIAYLFFIQDLLLL